MPNGEPKNTYRELDQSTGVESRTTQFVGAIVGGEWGPNLPVKVASETELLNMVGAPIISKNNLNWMMIRELLNGYTKNVAICRGIVDSDIGASNACMLFSDALVSAEFDTTAETGNGLVVPRKLNKYDTLRITDSTTAFTFKAGQQIYIYGKYAGKKGNDLAVAIADAQSVFEGKTVDGVNVFTKYLTAMPFAGKIVKQKVIALADPTIAPPTEGAGYRYLLGYNTGTVHADWDGASKGSLVEYVAGTTNAWTEVKPSQDFVVFATTDNKYYVYDTTTKWTAYDQQLAIVVFKDGIKVEDHIVSTATDGVDMDNQNIYIEDYLAENSNYIEAVVNTGIKTVAGYSEAVYLTKGDSAKITTTEVKKSIDKIMMDEDIYIRKMIDYHDLTDDADVLEIHNYILSAIATYKHVFMVGTLPDVIDDQSATPITDAITYAQSISVESRGAVCNQWKQVKDEYNNKRYFIPCSGDFAGVIVRTPAEYDLSKSTYGYRRGQLVNASVLKHTLRIQDRDTLVDNRVNTIVRTKKGTIVASQRTLYNNSTSALSRIPGREVQTQIELDIMNYLEDENGENNNEITRKNITNNIDAGYLKAKKDDPINPWLIDYKFQCDEKNNTPEVIDQWMIKIYVGTKLQRQGEFIDTLFVIKKTSASFDEA